MTDDGGVDVQVLAAHKRELRRALQARLAALPPSTFVEAGAALVAALTSRLDDLARARQPVALYASRAAELSTDAVSEACRLRGIPRLLPRMVVGEPDLRFVVVPMHMPLAALPLDRWGIGAPDPVWPEVPLTTAGLVIVPGLGFDDDGGRLGYGRGYYDRALVDVDPERAIGVGVDVQRVPQVPTASWDRRLRWQFFPATGLRRCGSP